MTGDSASASPSEASSSSSPSSSFSVSSLTHSMLDIWMPSSWLLAENSSQLPKHDLLFVPIICLLLYLLRSAMEKLAVPLALKLGIPPHKKPPNQKIASTPSLENLFQSRDRSHSTISRVASENHLSPNQIQFWLRRRQKSAKLAAKRQLIDKFKETFCRFWVESIKLAIGFCVLRHQPWFWSIPECWRGWPNQHRDLSIRIYYVFQMSFCSFSLLTHFGEVRRKDFWQMFVHHIVTLFLVFGSWITNVVRIGSIILFLHDIVDPVLQVTKLAAYSKVSESLSTFLFALFAFLWFSTRLVFFPLRVISSCASDRIRIFSEEGVVDDTFEIIFRIFVFCLWILYVLHWIWFYSIIVLIVKVAKGENVKDTRSEDEAEEEEEKKEKQEEEEEEEKGEEALTGQKKQVLRKMLEDQKTFQESVMMRNGNKMAQTNFMEKKES